jgi:hypothetical protein
MCWIMWLGKFKYLWGLVGKLFLDTDICTWRKNRCYKDDPDFPLDFSVKSVFIRVQ